MATETGWFCTEGFQFMLELMNGAQSKPANYYIGLVEDATVGVSDNLAGLTELSGDGYSAQAVTSNGTDLVSASDGGSGWQLTSKTVRFTASGAAWNTVKHAIFKTSSGSTGKLIGAMPLNGSAGITVPDGYYFDVTMVLKQPVPA